MGNPVRNTLENGGGYINPGVNPDGTQNTKRVDGSQKGGFGFLTSGPLKEYVYDASYVKLRQLVLNYQFSKKYLKNYFLKDVSVSLVGSNLWIIHKNLPYADPESTSSSGNIQGFQTGAFPSFRTYALNVNVSF